ncbi:MAG: NTP transferase domain-containing protein [Sporichthyaceae bacterium]
MSAQAGSAAGVVLAGGRSSRMGAPKSALDWHGTTLLHRVTALLARTLTGPVVVVAAPGQELPALPAGVEVARDPVEGSGPLQGITGGLAAVGERAPRAFVCSTDLPFLHPAYVLRVLSLLDEDHDVALPFARGHRQPLGAAYSPALADLGARLLAAGSRKPGELFAQCRVRVVSAQDLLADAVLRRLDPQLDSVRNINTPEEYAAARAEPAPAVDVHCYGALASRARIRSGTVAAATLGAAARAVGLVLDHHVVAALNGERISRDHNLPLVPGDSVSFISADAGG